LNRANDQACRALSTAGEKQDFSDSAVRDLISDSLTVTKINVVLDEVGFFEDRRAQKSMTASTGR
jgi:hypothetical protein